MPSDNLADDLAAAVRGLSYPSESDAPFDLVRFGRAGNARDQINVRAAGRKVVEVPTGFFFDQLKDSDDAERFASLRLTLECLTDLTIFRVGGGEVIVDIFLIGKNQSGEWIGLKTRSVET